MFRYKKKYMIYVFEGPRNSGKTFLSEHISEAFNIPRFQFKFTDFFSELNLKSENSKEAHAFSLGKEFMLMQLAKDIPHGSFIHDRGILSVLVWGLLEERISEDEARDQIGIIKKHFLLDEITLVYIEGQNPDKSDRSKDQWDHIDGDTRERDTYKKVISMFQEVGLHKIWAFTNKFDDQSVSNIGSMFGDILFN